MDKTAHKAIGYIRVSTELQAADGISLDAQRESLEDYCNAHKLNLIAVRKLSASASWSYAPMA